MLSGWMLKQRRKHFRQSLYLALFFIDRSTISVGKQSETLLGRLGKRVDEILATDATPTISAALVRKLEAFK